MPYVICADCHLLTYSAQLWASTEHCPRCGAPQPAERRAALLAVAQEPAGEARAAAHPLLDTIDDYDHA